MPALPFFHPLPVQILLGNRKPVASDLNGVTQGHHRTSYRQFTPSPRRGYIALKKRIPPRIEQPVIPSRAASIDHPSKGNRDKMGFPGTFR